ncbi:hypothetical protein Vafri_20688 [Volvox africanus]|nr:hypothetical protein Vafri_20688 [Volvox africanus]
MSNPDGAPGHGAATPRPHTGNGSTSAGGGPAAAVPASPVMATTPSCPLPGKDSAPAALAALGGGASTVTAAAATATGGGATGGPEHSALSGNVAPVLPSPVFGRMSAGSNTGLPSAALLKPAKPPTPKVHAILMEYCNLGGLHKYIDNRMFFKDRIMPEKGSDAARGLAPLPPESVHMDYILATLSEVASALQYLHTQGFVHCDLKPENVLLKEANNRRGFTAKLADFGLSELRSPDGQVVGDLGGTVTHVAPESVLHRQVSSASDMYAFGILMWELYTGQQPYRELLSHISKREDRHRALLVRVVHEGLRPSFPSGVPQDYFSLAAQCWSPEPSARPTTGDVLQVLEVMYTKYAGST